eukprot:6458071-Amphidinium_carterae.1
MESLYDEDMVLEEEKAPEIAVGNASSVKVVCELCGMKPEDLCREGHLFDSQTQLVGSRPYVLHHNQ